MNSIAIELESVTKTFSFDKPDGFYPRLKQLVGNSKNGKRLVALDNVSIKISKGEVLGIIGNNGSGKTTLLRTIAGIYTPDSGRIIVNGCVAPLLQIGIGFQNELNGEENIIISGMLFGLSKSNIKEKVDEIFQFAELQKFSNMKLKHYSSGMKARLAFSTALQINPDILLVDEILAVGDASFVKKSSEAFLSFKKKGKTILLCTHNLAKLSNLCDRVLLLHEGRAVTIGKPDTIIEKYRELNEN